jgi:DNA mismatch endonuclease (patch repair protein)
VNPPAASSPAALARMRRQARRDTRPELALRRALWQQGLRYRLHRRVPGTRRTIDVAFPGARVAVFVDGCYWHGCPLHGTAPKANAEWWAEKLAANRARDADTDRRLRAAGWRVLRFWEHTDPADAAAAVRKAAARRASIGTATASGHPLA